MSQINSSLLQTTTAIPLIQIITPQMTVYGSITILVVGTCGSICNFITFTSSKLRKNPCAFYFLMSSIFELISIHFGLISRLASENFGSNLLSIDRFYCKFRAYLVSAIPLTATYFILLASLDRSMSSSTNIRRRSFSQMNIAYLATIVVVFISFSTCSHILITYDLRPRCSTMTGPYSVFDGLFVVCWLGILPHTLMLFFALLTILNIKNKRRRIESQNMTNSMQQTAGRKREKNQSQLIFMMLFQVGFSFVLIMIRMIFYAYSILTPSQTGYNRLIMSFFSSFTILLYYANYAKSFYLYTLSSHLFRSVFVDRMKSVFKMIRGIKNQAQPQIATNTIQINDLSTMRRIDVAK